MVLSHFHLRDRWWEGGEAKYFANSMRMFFILANVADMKSLVIHPTSTIHSQLSEKQLEKVGIVSSTIRLSIGCEHIENIIVDLTQALDRV